jgi:hypothetical protein
VTQIARFGGSCGGGIRLPALHGLMRFVIKTASRTQIWEAGDGVAGGRGEGRWELARGAFPAIITWGVRRSLGLLYLGILKGKAIQVEP